MGTTSAAIVAALAAEAHGLTPFELADRVGVHHTAVRRHLDRLVSEGRATVEREHQGGRGRPTHRYCLTDATVTEQTARDELLQALVGLLDVAEVPRERIAEMGRVHGARGRPVEGRREIVAEVGRLGFGPREISSGRGSTSGALTLRLCNCPFRETVKAPGGDAVCALHQGIVEGIAEAAGGELTRFDSDDPDAGNCVLEITGVE